MLRVPKSIFVAGAVVAAAGLMLLANPKTVHAVAAALVQVTNTASNPAVTQSVGRQAAQIVEVHCDQFGCFQYQPDSSISIGYVVPAGQSLVITSVDVEVDHGRYANTTPQPCPGFSEVDMGSNASVRESWFFAANSGTEHFTYPDGIVIGSGFSMNGQLESNTSGCEFGFQLQGYLTPN